MQQAVGFWYLIESYKKIWHDHPRDRGGDGGGGGASPLISQIYINSSLIQTLKHQAVYFEPSMYTADTERIQPPC